MKITQKIEYNSSVEEVYSALTTKSEFAQFTGASAEIDAEPGGSFSCFDGMITGFTLELEPGKRIVQAWRAGNWDDGVYSIIRIDLEQTEVNKTQLKFEHSGFPEEHISHLEQGWHDRYWEPLRAFLQQPG